MVKINSRKSFEKKAEYVFQTFFNTLGIKEESKSPVRISYGNSPSKNGVNIEEGETQYFEKLIPYNIKDVRYFVWKGKKLPILFYTHFKEGVDLFSEVQKNKTLPVDIIASSFFFLSSWQELISKVRDKFGRFPFSESIQYKLGISTFPVVNEYMHIFLDLLELADCKIRLSPFWPQDKKFAVCLTHDIDDIKKWTRKTYREEIKDIMRTKRITPALDYWVFKKVCELEKERGFRSSFYFIPAQAKGYNINALHFSRVFKQLKANHWEIGLHSISEEQAELLAKEKEDLEKACGVKILGVRHHFLRLKNPQGFNAHEMSGLKYDSSLGFAEHPGYRTSFAFPYYPYNPEEKSAFRVLEIPLNIMDVSLIHHQHLNPKEMWEGIEQLLITNLDYKGCLTILWHESSFDDPVYTKLYTRILDWIQANGGIGLSAEQILKWWTERNYPTTHT